jgi:hypothetical protein
VALAPVTIAEVRRWIIDDFDIPRTSVKIWCYHPEDFFLIVFSFYDDMLRVLHDPLPVMPPPPFTLIFFKRW